MHSRTFITVSLQPCYYIATRMLLYYNLVVLKTCYHKVVIIYISKVGMTLLQCDHKVVIYKALNNYDVTMKSQVNTTSH